MLGELKWVSFWVGFPEHTFMCRQNLAVFLRLCRANSNPRQHNRIGTETPESIFMYKSNWVVNSKRVQCYESRFQHKLFLRVKEDPRQDFEGRVCNSQSHVSIRIHATQNKQEEYIQNLYYFLFTYILH